MHSQIIIIWGGSGWENSNNWKPFLTNLQMTNEDFIEENSDTSIESVYVKEDKRAVFLDEQVIVLNHY